MTQVTKDQFYEIIFRDKLNVHPRCEPDASYWEFPNRQLFGKSTPGLKGEGPTGYFVA
jgi:hypothetical protein